MCQWHISPTKQFMLKLRGAANKCPVNLFEGKGNWICLGQGCSGMWVFELNFESKIVLEREPKT